MRTAICQFYSFALAQRIIDWREANGPFTEVSQLMEVAGIGDAVYSGLVDLVSL
ncbi:ComEA family DNA-binding protein [Agromyces sp. ZXT2-3]|uniref:ComEA family DNA-binding protein n=1 Tax=Agromyces sp. ZXT2-3 TaxID=3461152 RepID=UPI004054AC07